MSGLDRMEGVIREALCGLRESPSANSSAAFDRIQRLLSSSGAETHSVDAVYDGVLRQSTELLADDFEALGCCVDLLKRALLRHLPSFAQLGRIDAWCEVTVREHKEASLAAPAAEEGREEQRTLLVNSLKFLKRLVGRHIDTWREQHEHAQEEQEHLERRRSLSLSPSLSVGTAEEGPGGNNDGDGGDGDDYDEEDGSGSGSSDREPHASKGVKDGNGLDAGAAAVGANGDGGSHKEEEEEEEEGAGVGIGGCVPQSALCQLRANAEPAARRRSSISSLIPSSSTSAGAGAASQELFSRPENEQNRFFKDLLEDRTKSISELGENVKLVLAYMMEMYDSDPQQTFVVVSIFLQEMLLENTAVIQKRAFDIFLNLVYHWQNSVTLATIEAAERELSSSASPSASAAAAPQPAREREHILTALILRDAMWHVSLLNEMCLVLLECEGEAVPARVWRCAHSCLLFCCARKGVLVPKLVKLVSFEVLQNLLAVSRDKAGWSQAAQGTILSMMACHLLPYRGNHLGLDSQSLQLVGGEAGILRLMRTVASPVGLANLFVLVFFLVAHKLNGPAITLTGDHLINTHLGLLERFLRFGAPAAFAKALREAGGDNGGDGGDAAREKLARLLKRSVAASGEVDPGLDVAAALWRSDEVISGLVHKVNSSCDP
mmetsp:Transcript_34412/g.74536  ORF Transcript_34412/g.74536 Transcript_34412/m.74536 type:complete len:664 (+) Transcript_34412:175-2166(+)